MEAILVQTLQATHELGKDLLTIRGAEAKKCGARRKLGKSRHTCRLAAVKGRAYHELRLIHRTEEAAVRRSTPTTGRTFCTSRSFTPGGTLGSSGQSHFRGPGISVNCYVDCYGNVGH
ncbi:hypothetical protein MRX96_054193 [Rhipicephalus microplus]